MGSDFQAEIPPLRNRLLVQCDEHPAQLVWAPWGDLPSNPETQQKGFYLHHTHITKCSSEFIRFSSIIRGGLLKIYN